MLDKIKDSHERGDVKETERQMLAAITALSEQVAAIKAADLTPEEQERKLAALKELETTLDAQKEKHSNVNVQNVLGIITALLTGGGVELVGVRQALEKPEEALSALSGPTSLAAVAGVIALIFALRGLANDLEFQRKAGQVERQAKNT